MNSKKVYHALLGALGLTIIAVLANLFLANSSLEKNSQKLVKLKLDNRILDEQQVSLVQANKDIAKYSDLEKIAKAVVPQDKDQARVVREISSLASDVAIPIQLISFPTSTLGQTKSPASATPSSSSSTIKAVPSQVKSVPGSSGLYQLEITVQSDTTKPVSFQQLVNFLTKLEQNRRTAQVTGITVTPSTTNRKLITFSLILNVYIKP